METILVPLDNRPVTYVFPQLIARIAGIRPLVPPRHLMGSLSNESSSEAVNEWLMGELSHNSAEALLVCTDSIIYGGLISSRRTNATPSQLLERTKAIARWKKQSRALAAVYAQSSIMRVSDNDDNTEEKFYWSRYGRDIFAWSEALHRLSAAGTTGSEDHRRSQSAKLQQLESRIDPTVREDYLNTRRRNFQINKRLLDYVESGDIDLLIFSQDDSAQFGLNVLEKDRLLADAEQRKMSNVLAYAGADEVIMTMMARWLVSKCKRAPAIKVSFSPSTGSGITSRYEGQTIGDSVRNQLRAAGLGDGTPNEQSCDLHLIIHTGGERQGDHIWLPRLPDLRAVNTAAAVKETLSQLERSTTQVVLCDLAYANGADPILIQHLLEKPELVLKLWGYAGWNTSGNTLGSAIAMGVARWFAEQSNSQVAADAVLKQALFVRLVDDWAYQANVRKELGSELSLERLRQMMVPYINSIQNGLNYRPPAVELSLPWKRSFEVEVSVVDPIQAAR